MKRLVGRESDLIALTDAVHRVGLTAVVGSAGMGKTTLVRAALERTRHHEGGALRSLVNRPYLPLERALQVQLLGGVEDVAEAVIVGLDGSVLFIDDLHWAHDRCIEALDLVRTEACVVVASRREGLGASGVALVESGYTIEIDPLAVPDALTLGQTLHPRLEVRDLHQLVALAGGSPLLLDLLVDERQPSPTLAEALSARVARLDPRTLDALRRLALAGRPIEAGLVGLEGEEAGGLVQRRGDLVELRHALLGDAVLGSITAHERRLLHTQLGSRLAGAEAVRHLLAGDRPERALETARSSRELTEDASARAELGYLAAIASEKLGSNDPDVWLAAASALVDAGQYDNAIDAAERAARDAHARPEARYLEGRARWFLGDPEGATGCLDAALGEVDEGTPLSVRILVERAYVDVRARRPGAIETASRAFEAAKHDDAEGLRAQAVLGASLLYEGRPGWEEQLTGAVERATRVGDTELACTAAFHLASGLAFVGRVGEAIAVGSDQLRISEAAGLRTWRAHYLAALILDRMMTGEDPAWVAANARLFIEEHPLFRNRFEAEASLVLALGDMDRAVEARAAAELHLRRATTPESRVFALAALAEVAWLEGSDREVLDLALVARPLGDAWFGVRMLCEIAGNYAAVELGVEFAPMLPALILPLHWPALHEINGLRCWQDGNVAQALEEFDHASTTWSTVPCPRWALRAETAAAVFARRAHHPGAGARVKAAVEHARASGFTHHLRRWGLLSPSGLTAREEQVLRLVAAGRTSAEIAGTFGIAPGTVDDHVESARRKLGAKTRREAARLVLEQ